MKPDLGSVTKVVDGHGASPDVWEIELPMMLVVTVESLGGNIINISVSAVPKEEGSK